MSVALLPTASLPLSSGSSLSAVAVVPNSNLVMPHTSNLLQTQTLKGLYPCVFEGVPAKRPRPASSDSDGTEDSLVTSQAHWLSKTDPVFDFQRPPTPESGSTGSGPMSLLLTYENVGVSPAADEIGLDPSAYTYQVTNDHLGFHDGVSLTRSSDTLAYNGRWSVHRVYDGGVDMHVRDWETGQYVNLDCGIQEWNYTANFIKDYVIVLTASRVLLFDLESIDRNAVEANTEAELVEPTATLEFSNMAGVSGHRSWSAVVQPIASDSKDTTEEALAVILRRNAHSLSAFRLERLANSGGFDLCICGHIEIDPELYYLSAMGLDDSGSTAAWLLHDICCRSYVMSANIDLQHRGNKAFRPSTLYKSQPGHPLVHCDAMWLPGVDGAIVITQKYSSVGYVLKACSRGQSKILDMYTPDHQFSGIAGQPHKLNWQPHPGERQEDSHLLYAPVPKRRSLRDAISTICADQITQKWSSAMRQCPSPSVRQSTTFPLRIAKDRLPHGYRLDVQDVSAYYYKFPDGGLEALLRGFDVPGIPRPVAYSAERDQLIAGLPFDGYDIFYGLQEGEGLAKWTISTYTLMPEDKLRLPDHSLHLECCAINRDNIFTDFARAIDLDSIKGIDPTERAMAMERFGLLAE
ncbi:hypothetical protein CALCODRAFT_526863 [Calocera cornea HHB12733]|uniref:Uncharacterized protein n=1 Tax=Calocera cornea HHB12733 TaxID=1353952 RepID=A0A165E9H3_9BASI|nr:hypothetical protein CALCODRAFT_526863 [Calocera cornea HHB12733]